MIERHLSNPEPDPLEDIPRLPLRPEQVRSIHGSFAGVDIGLHGPDEFRSLEDLPEGVEDEVDRDADIRGDEVVNGPGAEDVEAVEEDDDGEEDEREVSGVRLER